MKVLSSDMFIKTSNSLSLAVTSAVRNTSCSHGWLRVVIHCFFGAITVTSFILIVIMSIKSPPPKKDSRCTVNGCRVACHIPPHVVDYEDDILVAVTLAEEQCKGIKLVLHEPHFRNATLPPRWLQKLPSNINALEIKKGNLRQISAQAFMTHLGEELRSLSFEGITIERWSGDILLGLLHLETLRIESSTLEFVRFNSLKPVAATLQNLFVTDCGKDEARWRPWTFTGSERLVKMVVVEFSNNYFPVLQNHSFTKLQSCKVLYLDYCKISAIELGTFDYLTSIEVIYLDNNHLTVVTPGLFNTLIALTNPLPRITIHENYWQCNCSHYDLRELNRKGMILVDTACYSPEEFNGTSLVDFEYYCQDQNVSEVLRYNDTTSIPSHEISHINNSTIIHHHDKCPNSSVSSSRFYDSSLRIKCSSQIKLELTTSIQDEKDRTVITPRFAIADSNNALLEISSRGSSQYGLVWYQSVCPKEIYCVNVLPAVLRIYGIDLKTKYTFCPMNLLTGNVHSRSCVNYIVEDLDRRSLVPKMIGYLVTSIFFLAFGASCLYAIILKFPALLKGSKRILFVKHKNVDALILPPKVPLKTVLSRESFTGFGDKKVFLVSDPAMQQHALSGVGFMSVLSRRSSKSVAPSYVSALQPTDDQLADWRLRHHFHRDPADCVNSLNSSFMSIENGPESFSADTLYESLK